MIRKLFVSLLVLFVFAISAEAVMAGTKKVCSKPSPTNKKIVAEFTCTTGEEGGDCDFWITRNGKKNLVYPIRLYTSYESLPPGFSCDTHAEWSSNGVYFAFWTQRMDLTQDNANIPHIVVYNLDSDTAISYEGANISELRPLKYFSDECAKTKCDGVKKFKGRYFSFDVDEKTLEFNEFFPNSDLGGDQGNKKSKSCYILKELDRVVFDIQSQSEKSRNSMKIRASCKK